MSPNPFHAAFRRRLAQQVEPGSLAELAVSKYDESATRAEQEAARNDDEQRRIRENWAAQMEERQGPILTRKLADSLNISRDHLALSGLTWYMDREKLAELTFTMPPGAVGIDPSDADKANLYADVAPGVLIEAAPWDTGAVSSLFCIVADTKTASKRSLGTLAQLGEAIARSRHAGPGWTGL